jgi:hypothetical protein
MKNLSGRTPRRNDFGVIRFHLGGSAALAALVVDSRYNFIGIACKLRSIRTVLVGLILVLILIVFEGLGPAVDVFAA